MDSLLHYNIIVTESRQKYFLQLISTHKCDAKFLFKASDQLVNPVPSCAPAENSDVFSLFHEKSGVTQSLYYILTSFTNVVVLIKF